MKSLFEILNSSESWNIIKKNQKLFCQNEQQEQHDITQFQFEFNKILISNISQQKRNDCFINNELNSVIGHDSVLFDNLILTSQEDITFKYLSLITELALGSEEFSIQIDNPFTKREIKNDVNEIRANKMTLIRKEHYSCEVNHFSQIKPDYYQFFELLKTSQIQQILIEDLVFQISSEFHYCKSQNDSHGNGSCEFHPMRVNNINLITDNIKYKNLCIEISDTSQKNLQIVIPFSLKQLLIKPQDFYFPDEINLKIKFIHSKGYISRMIMDLQGCEGYIRQIDYLKMLKKLEIGQVSEYAHYFHPNTIPIDQLYQLDENCEKIIYFYHIQQNTHRELNQESKELAFIKSRNFLNAMKFQVFSFNFFISQSLHFSPTQTLLDLYLVD